MRAELSEVEGKLLTFVGTCYSFGSRTNRKKIERTILFKEIISDNISIEHMWFDARHFSNKIREGYIVSWESRVKKYVKGYKGLDPDLLLTKPKNIDYRLSLPKNVKIIGYKKPERYNVMAKKVTQNED